MQDLIETEQQRLYQTANLTDNLEDDDAKILLSWASKQVAVIAGRAGSFESHIKTLRKLVKDINFFIGNVEDLASDEQIEELNRMFESATELAYPTREDAMEDLVEAMSGTSPADMLTILFGWIEDNSSGNNDETDAIPTEDNNEADAISTVDNENSISTTYSGDDINAENIQDDDF